MAVAPDWNLLLVRRREARALLPRQPPLADRGLGKLTDAVAAQIYRKVEV